MTENRRSGWKSARDRDRNRARFLLRERLGNRYQNSTTNIDDDKKISICSLSNAIQRKTTVNDETAQLVEWFLEGIEMGATSRFSLAVLERHYDLLSQASLPVDRQSCHFMSLATSRFGIQYAECLKKHMEDSTKDASFVEYAGWLGQYDIVASLLQVGILTTAKPIANRQRAIEMDIRSSLFSDPYKIVMPSSLLVYIVCSIQRMKFTSTYSENKNVKLNCPNSCMICHENFTDKRVTLLQMPCKSVNENPHVICEWCVWNHILKTLNPRQETNQFSCDGKEDFLHKNVMTCPVCHESLQPLLSQLTPKSSNSKNLPLPQRHENSTAKDPITLSKEKFASFPKTIQELKKSSMKKKIKKNAIYSTWYDAIVPTLGSSQDVRIDKFLRYINHTTSMYPYIAACLYHGIDISRVKNEYNQSPLYLACWKGDLNLVRLLLQWVVPQHSHNINDDQHTLMANGELTIFNVAKENHHDDVYQCLLQHYNSISEYHIRNHCHGNEDESFISIFEENKEKAISIPTFRERMHIPINVAETAYMIDVMPKWNILLNYDLNHPGAGAGYIDNLLPEATFEALAQFCEKLPLEAEACKIACKKKKKTQLLNADNNCAAERKYFCDAEGKLIRYIAKFIQIALDAANARHNIDRIMIFPHMRILSYRKKSSYLGPHVDLTRTDPSSQKRSTFTFLYYLTDCEKGGETALLRELSPDGPLANHDILVNIKPKRNRMLIFPHACPHQGMEVVSLPKTLIRGELLFE